MWNWRTKLSEWRMYTCRTKLQIVVGVEQSEMWNLFPFVSIGMMFLSFWIVVDRFHCKYYIHKFLQHKEKCVHSEEKSFLILKKKLGKWRRKRSKEKAKHKWNCLLSSTMNWKCLVLGHMKYDSDVQCLVKETKQKNAQQQNDWTRKSMNI